MIDRVVEVHGLGASIGGGRATPTALMPSRARHVVGAGAAEEIDWTVPAIVGGVVVVGGLLVWMSRAEAKRREERQRGMTATERSVDDCLQTVGQAIIWKL